MWVVRHSFCCGHHSHYIRLLSTRTHLRLVSLSLFCLNPHRHSTVQHWNLLCLKAEMSWNLASHLSYCLEYGYPPRFTAIILTSWFVKVARWSTPNFEACIFRSMKLKYRLFCSSGLIAAHCDFICLPFTRELKFCKLIRFDSSQEIYQVNYRFIWEIYLFPYAILEFYPFFKQRNRLVQRKE